MQVEASRAKARKGPATVRLAVWSSRHRWLVFGLWFAVTVGIFASGLVLGTRTKGLNDSDGTVKLEASKGGQAFNADNQNPDKTAPKVSSDDLVVVVTHPALKTNDPAFRDLVNSLAENLKAQTYTQNSATTPLYQNVLNPLEGLNGLQLVSQDTTAVRVVAHVQAATSKEVHQKLIEADKGVKAFKEGHKDFQIYNYNGYLLDDEFEVVLTRSLDGSLILTIPLTFIILLIAFGTVAAAVIPLILAATSLLAAFGLLAIYSHIFSPIDTSSEQVVVLIGLAVGIDYSLFMITRYRSERRRGRDKAQAIEVASSTAGRAVFFSGLTVMISLAGLYLIGDATFTSMASGTIGVVLAAVIGSLTFLPATMSILGNGINWGRIPYFGREREEGSGFWGHFVLRVMRRPIVSATVVVVLLLAMGFPLLHIRLGQNSINGLPASMEGSKALKVLTEKWPQGTTLQMNVYATNASQPETKAALEKFRTEALQTKGLSNPSNIVYSRGGNVGYVSFYMGGTRNDEFNQGIVRKIRGEVLPSIFGKINGVQTYVGGGAAYTLDANKFYTDAVPLVFGFVLGLSFLLLLVAFHSLIIPIKAILLNLLSSGAAYGAMVLVFQDGYFTEQIGFKPTGVIENFTPIFMFAIMFGLSMDYHLFILTRIKEAKDKGASSNEAVAQGISVTSGTVTSAAAIMVVVFSVFVTLEIMIVRQLGLGLAVAVFVDATLIRCILLPATMRLLGDWNWWMPKFLDWIPHITIEAEPEDVTPAPSQEQLVEAVN